MSDAGPAFNQPSTTSFSCDRQYIFDKDSNNMGNEVSDDLNIEYIHYAIVRRPALFGKAIWQSQKAVSAGITTVLKIIAR